MVAHKLIISTLRGLLLWIFWLLFIGLRVLSDSLAITFRNWQVVIKHRWRLDWVLVILLGEGRRDLLLVLMQERIGSWVMIRIVVFTFNDTAVLMSNVRTTARHLLCLNWILLQPVNLVVWNWCFKTFCLSILTGSLLLTILTRWYITLIWLKRIAADSWGVLSVRVNFEGEAILLLHYCFNVRLNETDISVALEGVHSPRSNLIELLIWVLSSKRDTLKTVSFRLSIHDIHYLLQHLLVFGVDFSHLVIALVDTARAEMSELFRLLLVNVSLQVEELVNQVSALLSLHQHRGRVAG